VVTTARKTIMPTTKGQNPVRFCSGGGGIGALI
jgi:hypothetical protein